jgi:ketosteroid isomerase-like protein
MEANNIGVDETRYDGFDALKPFFEIIQTGLSGLVDGEHFFDIFAEKVIQESRYEFPGWKKEIRGREDLINQFSGYGTNIRLNSADNLVVHHCQDHRTVILEYEVHGTILTTMGSYNNRFISVIAIENRKITHWRDYMDSLAAWNALTGR